MKRWLKYKYLLLLRAKGGSAIVARGFAIGLAIEMFTLPTGGLAFFLIFPLVYLFRASLAGALLGFVFGKIIYIPMAFLNNKVGSLIVPRLHHQDIPFLPHWIERLLFMNLRLIVGGMIVGTILGIVLYFPLKWMLDMYTVRRKERRRQRQHQLHQMNMQTQTDK